VGAPSGMDAMYLLEENELLTYEGYETVGRSLPTRPLGTHREETEPARRALKPIDTEANGELWLGYAWKKFGKYYSGGGWELQDSRHPEQYLRVGTNRVTNDAGRFGHFQLMAGEESAVSREPIIEEGNVPESAYFVLVHYRFGPDKLIARLKSFESPEPMPQKVPTDWDIEMEVPGDWRLQLDTLLHRGKRENRLAIVDEFRIGTNMEDVLLVPENSSVKRTPLAEERFDLAPTIDRERGVVYMDTGGVNSSGEARDAWFVRFREHASNMPIVALITATPEKMEVRVVFYDAYEEYKAGDIMHRFEMLQ
ncbi:MAG: hypothetical protein ACOC29_00055, partial [Candidatus Sumerlaeota bacterium]